jgi:hypothetical protein
MDKYILPNREDIQIFEDTIKYENREINIPCGKIGLAALDNRIEKLQQVTQEMPEMQEES